MNRRRGISLIEMLVVISVGATLAGIAVLLLHTLMKSHNAGREHLQCCRTLNRLAEQFRSDVHAMQKTSPDNAEKAFTLMPDAADGVKIRYNCLKDRIDRDEFQGDKIVRQDSFTLPPDVVASIKTNAQQDATIACILISPKDNITPKLYYVPPVRIEAVLGRDFRLSKAISQPKSQTEGTP